MVSMIFYFCWFYAGNYILLAEISLASCILYIHIYIYILHLKIVKNLRTVAVVSIIIYLCN
jgi:hypothetical protein